MGYGAWDNQDRVPVIMERVFHSKEVQTAQHPILLVHELNR